MRQSGLRTRTESCLTSKPKRRLTCSQRGPHDRRHVRKGIECHARLGHIDRKDTNNGHDSQSGCSVARCCIQRGGGRVGWYSLRAIHCASLVRPRGGRHRQRKSITSSRIVVMPSCSGTSRTGNRSAPRITRKKLVVKTMDSGVSAIRDRTWGGSTFWQQKPFRNRMVVAHIFLN